MLHKLKPLNRDLLIKVAAISAFVSLCWFTQRSLNEPEGCVRSSFVAFARLGDLRVENCAFQNRIFPNQLPTTPLQRRQLQEIKALDHLLALFPAASPHLEVALSEQETEDVDLHRSAMIAAVLQDQIAEIFPDEQEVAMVSDFLNMALFGRTAKAEQEKFSTVVPTATKLRQLLAVALHRIYDRLSLMQKLNVLARLRNGEPLPALEPIHEPTAVQAAEWLKTQLNIQAQALQMGGHEEGLAARRALRELDVEAPTRWELTVDLTHSPAWRDIVEQLIKRSQFRKKERVLIFTPEGEVALPSQAPVQWKPQEIRSQKHVLVACEWPRPHEAVAVEARQLFAQKSCDKLKNSFWD